VTAKEFGFVFLPSRPDLKILPVPRLMGDHQETLSLAKKSETFFPQFHREGPLFDNAF
jgi:hypothetical protein